MNKNILCLITTGFLLLVTLATPLRGQETLYSFDYNIKQIAKDNQGKLSVLTQSEACTLQGNQIIEECYSTDPKAQQILPIDLYQKALITEKSILIIKNNILEKRIELPENIVKTILIGDDIFVGTSGKGLYSYNIHSEIVIQIGLEDEFINDIVQYQKGVLIALDDGIAYYDITTTNLNRKQLNKIIKHITPIGEWNVLAIDEFGYLFKLNNTLEVVEQKDSGYNTIHQISSVGKSVYFITEKACLAINESLEISLVSEGSFHSILGLHNVLLVSQNQNLISIDITKKVIELPFPVYSLAAGKDSNIWAGTNGKILKLENAKVVQTIVLPSTIENVSVSTLQIVNDRIYAGTMGDGLFVLEKTGKIIKHFLLQNENNKNNIIQLKYKDNLIWVGYLNGLLTINPNTLFIESDYSQLLGNNYLYSILPKEKENFYIGTSSEGIIHYNHGVVKKILSGNAVYCLDISEDTVYAGTEVNGLYKIDNDVDPLLVSDIKNIHYLHPYQQGVLIGSEAKNFWISESKTIPISIKKLNDILLNSCVSIDHFIYIGYTNGLLRIDLEKIAQLQFMETFLNPPLLYGKKVVENKRLFNYDENSFSFTYHPKLLYETNNIVYKYRLLGLDSIWQETQQNKVNFYNLKPDTYTFEIASGLDSTFTPIDPASYNFTIARPFWKTWWFILLVSSITIIFTYFLLRIRERHLLNEEIRERQNIRYEFEKLKNQIDPHFLFNSLNSLIGAIEENPTAAITSIEQLSELYRDILTYEKVDLISLEKELELAKKYFKIHQLRYEKLIELSILIDQTKGIKVVPLCCQFLIENAIKHNIISSSRILKITITTENSYLVVKNTFNKKKQRLEKREGLGIENLKNRYRYFTKTPLEIQQTKKYFCVKLPLIYD